MKFQIPSIGPAVLMTLLCMGIVGMFIVVPIACIQWTWNSVMSKFELLPLINAWQALLLYIAVGIVIYLTGLVRIEFETENFDA